MAPRPKNPPADRRQEILNAALQIFAQKGYNATTNADIAREAGVTPAALYYYFASKEELFRAAVTDLRGQFQPAMALFEGEELLEIPPAELIPQVLRHVIGILSEERNKAILKIIIAEGPRDPSILAIWQEQMVSVIRPLFPYLIHHMQQGRIKPMDPRLFFLLLQGPLMAVVVTRDLLGLSLLQDITNEMLLDGLLGTTLRGLLIETE
ncbi:MAG: TetR/AcrR family transcriptional regulator [Bacillota bacterium]